MDGHVGIVREAEELQEGINKLENIKIDTKNNTIIDFSDIVTIPATLPSAADFAGIITHVNGASVDIFNNFYIIFF